MKRDNISYATQRNWERLHPYRRKSLALRANKTESEKSIFPAEYISDKGNTDFFYGLLEAKRAGSSVWEIIRQAAKFLLLQKGLLSREHAVKALAEYKLNEVEACPFVPLNERDVLGACYQILMTEGEKNRKGAYYTPAAVASKMTDFVSLDGGRRLLDPCCGSGSLLLGVETKEPCNLIGFDNDYIAVFIAKVNLLLRFPEAEFMPQIFRIDFLAEDNDKILNDILKAKADFIVSNPPWGAVSGCEASYSAYGIESGESFSLVYVKAFELLKENGVIDFLFPKALLNVKAHRDIRKYLLDNKGIERIVCHSRLFSGVATEHVGIRVSKNNSAGPVLYRTKDEELFVEYSCFRATENLVFAPFSNIDEAIVEKVKAKGRYSLKDSKWAVGIVTGDNKSKLCKEAGDSLELIYTGKEIGQYVLKPAQNYLKYDRSQLQQVARDEFYRVPEKLVYKFISKRPVFAYDCGQRLFLNSANILIPHICNMSVKTVLAFLNSRLFQYLYIKLFGEVKILKGNLSELPFPDISKKEDKLLSRNVDKILKGDCMAKEHIDRLIYDFYGFTPNEISRIESVPS